MELVVNRSNRNEVFLFDKGLGEKVWEPEPITRFRFKNPVKNDWIKEQLSANKPTAGIVFNGEAYIGTKDVMIYSSKGKIQRIPEITVDPETFLDSYLYAESSDREVFERFREEGFKTLDTSNRLQLDRILKIDEEYREVASQERKIDRYITGRLNIVGFAVSKTSRDDPAELYDGHLLGITKTLSGKIINGLAPQALHQINPTLAGFVPSGYPPTETVRFEIENGFERRLVAHCVDYRSLWALNGQGIFVRDICPRDGSGYAPAKFATDGVITAISHGIHPWYKIDISRKTKSGEIEIVKSLDLDPNKTPEKLLIRNGEVFGDHGEEMWNFSRGELWDSPIEGNVTSIADSGLY